jgi:hypothetical protein
MDLEKQTRIIPPSTHSLTSQPTYRSSMLFENGQMRKEWMPFTLN